MKRHLLLTLAVLSGAAQAQDAQFRNPNSPFTFTLKNANDWQVLTPKENANLTPGVYLHKRPNALMQLLVNQVDGNIDTVPKLINEFEKFNFNGAQMSRLGEKAATYGGVAGREIEYRYTVKDQNGRSQDARLRLWAGIKGKNAYTFNLADSASTYAANRDGTFFPLLQSLQFK